MAKNSIIIASLIISVIISQNAYPEKHIDTYALIIDIHDSFQNRQFDINDLKKLFLAKYSFKEVILLSDQAAMHPDLKRVKRYLNQFLTQEKESDFNLLILFFGPGIREKAWLIFNEKLFLEDFCSDYLDNDYSKALNVTVISNNVFPEHLVRPPEDSLTPYDMGYSEKIVEKSLKKSRKLISFGNFFKEDTGENEYLFKTIHTIFDKNPYDIVDVENLLKHSDFNQISVKRLKGRNDEDGFFVLRKSESPVVKPNPQVEKPKPPVVKPKPSVAKPEPPTLKIIAPNQIKIGQKVDLLLLTNADKVHLFINNKNVSANLINEREYKNFSVNSGEPIRIKAIAIKGNQEPVEVAKTIYPLIDVQIQCPDNVMVDEKFSISLTTDSYAASVSLTVENNTYTTSPFSLANQKKLWLFPSIKFETEGEKTITAVALNTKNLIGPQQTKYIGSHYPVPINIIDVKMPDATFIGEPFDIMVTTDSESKYIRRLLINGKDCNFDIHPSNPNICFCKSFSFHSYGEKKITAVVYNRNDKPGKSIEVKKILCDFFAHIQTVSPKKVISEKNFEIKLTTDHDAKRVTFIHGREKGNLKRGKNSKIWIWKDQFKTPGNKKVKFIAYNRFDFKGEEKEFSILCEEEVSQIPLINLRDIHLPDTIIVDEPFDIKFITDLNITPGKDDIFLTINNSDRNCLFDKGYKKNEYICKDINIDTPGSYIFRLKVNNQNGQSGKPSSQIVRDCQYRLVKITQINAPDNVNINKDFKITCSTDRQAEEVWVTVQNRDYPMTSTNSRKTTWVYTHSFPNDGKKTFQIYAKNRSFLKGPESSPLTILVKSPNNVRGNIVPSEANSGAVFTFQAMTDHPAREVKILIDGKTEYKLNPHNAKKTKWKLEKKIFAQGKHEVTLITPNSKPYYMEFSVSVKQYKCNGNGTVTDMLTKKVINQYIRNSDGTIKDLCTGLLWLNKGDSTNYTYKEAQTYCKNLPQRSKYKEWRIPSKEEWDLLINKNQKPVLPESLFNFYSNSYNNYWTSTPFGTAGGRFLNKINLSNGSYSDCDAINDKLLLFPVSEKKE